MKPTPKPSLSYIKRQEPVIALKLKILPELKHEAESASAKLGTSLNRFVEASVKWYLDALKKDGSI